MYMICIGNELRVWVARRFGEVLCRRISYLATGPYAIWPWGEIVGESYTTDLEAVDCPDCSGYSR